MGEATAVLDNVNSQKRAARRRPVPALWSWPFRPFFPGAALLAASVVPVWLATLFGWMHPPLALPALGWHVHEMLFGFLEAALAGFLLTAVCHWTGTRPVAGGWLVGLFGIWLAGRALLFLGAGLPAWVPATVDLAFLPLVAAAAGRRIVGTRNWRNLPVLAAVTLLWSADLLFHLNGGALPAVPVRVAADAAILLMLIVGGRITPAFTNNWLRAHRPGVPGAIAHPWLEVATIGSAALTAALDLAAVPAAAGAVALAAGLLSLIRLLAWRGWSTVAEPLLWVLHLGMAWVSAALVLRGLSGWFGLPPTLWLHAVGAGAMGTLILGVMTRVSLGHTGRPLRLPRGAWCIYLAVIAAGALRVGAAGGLLDQRTGLGAAAFCWSLAFVLFLAYYIPILCRPRLDGKPG